MQKNDLEGAYRMHSWQSATNLSVQ